MKKTKKEVAMPSQTHGKHTRNVLTTSAEPPFPKLRDQSAAHHRRDNVNEAIHVTTPLLQSSTNSSETLGQRLEAFTEEVIASGTNLDAVLKPLAVLLEEKYRQDGPKAMAGSPWDRLTNVFADELFKIEARDYGAAIRLPANLPYHDTLSRTVVSILYRTGTNKGWLDGADWRDEDPFRSPLRFWLEKRSIWVPMLEMFVPAHRLVTAATDADPADAARQVFVLTEILRSEHNLIDLPVDDYTLRPVCRAPFCSSPTMANPSRTPGPLAKRKPWKGGAS